jgi:hypothetical protein
MKQRLAENFLLKMWTFGWLGIFLVVSLLGITSSSMRYIQTSDISSQETVGGTIGEPRIIRTDEYLRSSPWDLGLLKSGNANFTSPLADPNTSLIYPDPDSGVNYLNSVDTIWPRAIPGIGINQEFAFTWWTPVLLALIFLPVFLRQIGVGVLVAISVSTLIVTSPVNVWWSLWISPIIGYSALAAVMYLVVMKYESRNLLRIVPSVFLSAFCVFKLLTSYQPWVIVIAPMILVPAVVFAINSLGVKKSLLRLSAIFVTFVVLAGSFLISNSSALTTIQNTLYPGQRRSVGERISASLTWGAPHLQILNTSPEILGSNASELSSSFSVLAIAGLVIALNRRRFAKFSALDVSAALIVIIWLAWISIQMPNFVGSLPIFSLVTPNRAASVFGMIAILFFAYVSIPKPGSTPASNSINSLAIAALGGFLASLLTFIGGRELSQVVPRLGNIRIAIATILIFVVVFCLLVERLRISGLVLLAAFSVLMTVTVNPLQRSTNGIIDGVVVEKLVELSVPGSTWASDSGSVDALFMANAMNSISGQQLIGPSPDAWQILDPSGASEMAWNRGTSYISFTWSDLVEPEITSPSADVIQVSVSPCVLAEKFNSLEHVVSTKSLGHSCLSKMYEFNQNGTRMNVYEIN